MELRMELGRGGCWLWGSKVSRLYVGCVLIGSGMGTFNNFCGEFMHRKVLMKSSYSW
jgi:hypothetical protein